MVTHKGVSTTDSKGTTTFIDSSFDSVSERVVKVYHSSLAYFSSLQYCTRYDVLWMRRNHTLFGPHSSGVLLHMHLQWFLLQSSPCSQGFGGVSPYLHWHWHKSGLQSSNSKLQSSWLITHSHPHRVWFFSLIIFVSSVPTTFTVTGTSSYWSGMHDCTEGWMVSHDPPHRCNFTK